MKNILVTGANGQLGHAIYDVHNKYKLPIFNFIFTDIESSESYIDILDCTNIESVRKFVKENHIDSIINCVAYTYVSLAESNKELCEKLNIDVPYNLVKVCNENDLSLIHISSDYVYGDWKYSPYNESDIRKIKGVYAKTKSLGDDIIELKGSNYLIFRTSWLYYTGNNSFPAKISHKLNSEYNELINVVNNQIGTPTNAWDLAKAIYDIYAVYGLDFRVNNFDTGKPLVGIYNYSDMGVCSWFDFACEVERILYPNKEESQIVPIEYNDPIRPYYSVMSKNKIMQAFPFIKLPWWSISLKNFMSLNN